MSFRVRCNRCNSLASIRNSVEDSQEFKKLYCTCSNPECGHGFVMNLSFSHTLSPSSLDFPKEMIEQLSKLNRAQQRELFSALSAS